MMSSLFHLLLNLDIGLLMSNNPVLVQDVTNPLRDCLVTRTAFNHCLALQMNDNSPDCNRIVVEARIRNEGNDFILNISRINALSTASGQIFLVLLRVRKLPTELCELRHPSRDLRLRDVVFTRNLLLSQDVGPCFKSDGQLLLVGESRFFRHVVRSDCAGAENNNNEWVKHGKWHNFATKWMSDIIVENHFKQGIYLR